jgi:GTPase
VIAEIGAADRPMLRVYNKCDKAAAADMVSPAWSGAQVPGDRLKGRRLEISAVTGQGVDELRDAIRQLAVGHLISGQIVLGPTKSRARARLFEWQAVRGEQADDTGGWTLDVELTASRWEELRRSEGLAENDFRPQELDASCSSLA